MQKITLRQPEKVMQLARLGSSHQSRLSFMRVLIRTFKKQNWQFKRSKLKIDKAGVGFAVYQAISPERIYSLIAFTHNIKDEERNDRVIAEKWDATFALYDGTPTALEIKKLAKQVPLQEKARLNIKVLSLARANRSVRLYKYVLEQLSQGKQPSLNKLTETGYLMRTTAVYGSGKFGAALRELIEQREEFQAPFQVELLHVYLIRLFSIDFIEELAKQKSPKKAVKLEMKLKEQIGIGNSTGLGMAPFIINHPLLINNWILAKEKSLQLVRSKKSISAKHWQLLQDFIKKAQLAANLWNSSNNFQQTKIKELKKDLKLLEAYLKKCKFGTDYFLNHLYQWSEKNCSLEGQEQLVSLLLELYPELVDKYSQQMSLFTNNYYPETKDTVANLLKTCISLGKWCDPESYKKKQAHRYTWYISENKQEPRLGETVDFDDYDFYEQPIPTGKYIACLQQDLQQFTSSASIAEFLLAYPKHRHAIKRIQNLKSHPYSEIRSNLIGENLLAIDLLRFKLAFFGATTFDPQSTKWLRIRMYQNAPFPENLSVSKDDWTYPDIT